LHVQRKFKFSIFSKRDIAREADICLTTVNNRNKLFKLSNSTMLRPAKRISKYNPLEELARQRIRYYLAEENKSQKLFIQVLDKLHIENIEVSKSKARMALSRKKSTEGKLS